MTDITTINLLCGFILIVISYIISYIKNKEVPDLDTGLAMLLYGQAIISGGSMILYSITVNELFLINNRLILAFGGYALFYMGFDNYRKKMKEISKDKAK